ncbi:hypothetical protein [Streptomyces sp. CoH17]|uniref:hypothetical protein n=1 Tax=Streptomyces sp. CoH17 TaxID=2992806 RepID=UPI00226E8E30|nr:hypothetical protein [Streptomyces sp. CoH17]
MKKIDKTTWLSVSDGGRFEIRWIDKRFYVFDTELPQTEQSLGNHETYRRACKAVSEAQKAVQQKKLDEGTPAPVDWQVCEHGGGEYRSWKHKQLMCDYCWWSYQAERFVELGTNPSKNVLQSGKRLTVMKILALDLEERGYEVDRNLITEWVS